MQRKAHLVAAGIAALIVTHADAASYYVSASGNDSNSGTQADQPFKTPARAMSVLADGDSIFFRAGERFVVTEPLEVTQSGSAEQPLVIGAYQIDASGNVEHRATQRAVLDGNKKVPAFGSYVGIVHVTGKHVDVRDLELKNSGGLGLRFENTSNGRANNVAVNWTYFTGLQAYKSQNIEVTDCDVTGFGQGGRHYGEPVFPGGVSFRTVAGARVSGCVVHEGWGEGINAFYGSRDIVFENNVVFATRNLGIYVDSTHNAEVRNNLVLGTSNPEYHRYGKNTWVGPGIVLNNESYQFSSKGGDLSNSAALKNVRVVDNLVAGTMAGIAFWGHHPSTDWRGVVVAHNTFVDNASQITMEEKKFTSVQVVNNIFLSTSAKTADYSGTLTSPGITWSSNYWSSGKPPAEAASQTDVYDGLALKKMTGWLAIDSYDDVTWQDFQPVDSSTTVGAGTDAVKAIVDADFSGKAWSSPPDLGALAVGEGLRVPKAPAGLVPAVRR